MGIDPVPPQCGEGCRVTINLRDPASACPGAPSLLHPGVMRMCPTTCARWAFAAEGMEPAAERVDGAWQCANLVPAETKGETP